MMLFIIKKHTTGMLFFGRTKADINNIILTDTF